MVVEVLIDSYKNCKQKDMHIIKNAKAVKEEPDGNSSACERVVTGSNPVQGILLEKKRPSLFLDGRTILDAENFSI